MGQFLIKPAGVAINTRKTEQGSNYDWCIQTGTCQLLETAKRIYTTALCEVGDIESAKFTVIRKNKRLGLLIANIPTTRLNFAGGPIVTTLYLEFASDIQSVLNAATHLLYSFNPEKRQIFLDYAEEIFKNQGSSILPIPLPSAMITPARITHKTGLIYSSVSNRDQYAGYLTKIPNHFCFISTGYVGLPQYQELESLLDSKLLLLTTKELEKLPSCWTLKKVAFGLMILVLCVVIFIVIQKDSLSTQEQIKQLQQALIIERDNSSKLAADIRVKGQEILALQKPLKEQLEQIKKDKDAEIAKLAQKSAIDIRAMEVEISSLKDSLQEKNKQLENAYDVCRQPSKVSEIEEINQAVDDLRTFLNQKAVNKEQKVTEESLETRFEKNLSEDSRGSFYFKKYCNDFLAKRRALEEAIEKHREGLSSIPIIPDNFYRYCEK